MNLSRDRRALGRTGEARRLRATALERCRAALGGSHPATVGCARGIRADCDIEIRR
ncbi:hypothetical protein [Streptomyces sp. NPDC059168]|uniref:hypothetical protein n=1 Tax=Streptomyces sp. NPDC059168 TaxID=3346753 RepID=UPI003683C37A